jgi:NitT/TauT family transport system permease protein
MLRRLTQVRSSLPSWSRWILPIFPLIMLSALYLHCATERRRENPGDKLLPLPVDFGRAAVVATSRDEFTDTVPIVEDLRSSLTIYALGFGSAVVVALVVGLHVGTWSWAHAMFDPILRFFSYLPPLALLPLVMLFLGIGDLAKTFLIFISVVVPLTRSLVLRVQAVNEREIWNAMTLGASTPELIWIVFRRLTEPGFLDDVRLLIGTAWVYLIAAELIASNAGLGYRISVAGRNLNVAQIFLYIAVICVLAFAMDRAIHHLNRWRNRWAFA